MSQAMYHEALLALAKDRTKSGRLEPCDGSARADNPLCGDRVTIDLRTQGDKIHELAHKTRGCILTQAAAAMIARHAQGIKLDELQHLQDQAESYLQGDDQALKDWDEIPFFLPVRDVASRHECVLIAFRALNEAGQNLKT